MKDILVTFPEVNPIVNALTPFFNQIHQSQIKFANEIVSFFKKDKNVKRQQLSKLSEACYRKWMATYNIVGPLSENLGEFAKELITAEGEECKDHWRQFWLNQEGNKDENIKTPVFIAYLIDKLSLPQNLNLVDVHSKNLFNCRIDTDEEIIEVVGKLDGLFGINVDIKSPSTTLKTNSMMGLEFKTDLNDGHHIDDHHRQAIGQLLL